MQMAEQFDISTLAWVKGEIDDTLKQARMALERYVDDPDEAAELQVCVDYVHQVAGTLQMVELRGAALFAGEMEQFANALLQQQISDTEQAYELLMRAILQLPDYLERLLEGKADNPVALVPLLNELRQLRGERALDSAHFFRPNLRVKTPQKAGAGSVNVQAAAKKLHRFYINSLAKVLKDKDIAANLRTLSTVVEKLHEVAQSENLRRLMWVAEAFFEALSDHSLPLDRQSKPLLGKLEQLINVVAKKGEEGLIEKNVDILLQVLLFQLAYSDASGDIAAAVRKSFDLELFLPGADAGVSGLNAELKQTVSADIIEELTRVKDNFDIFVRSDRKNSQSLTPLADSLSNIGETLSMLQEDTLRQSLQEQVTTIRKLVDGEQESSDEILMGVAGAIIAVESALRDWGNRAPVVEADARDEQVADTDNSPQVIAEHQRVTRQVMKEAKDDLIRVREAINNYLENPQDKSLLETLPQTLHNITGSLTMLSYKRVAQVLVSTRVFIEKELIGVDTVPEQVKLDALADALMSVEYYLEAFVQSRVHPGSVLDVAEDAVNVLGYPIGTVTEALEEPEAEDADLGGIEVFESGQEKAAAEASPDTAAEVAAQPEMVEAPSGDFEEEAEETTAGEGEVAQQMAQQPEQVPAATASKGASVEVDDEILEIFIEEAEEEIENIRLMLPAWAKNPSDDESLKNLRRSFHTLKGSGRLVGALEMGEFAWAFENMLNRVIDGTIQHSATILDMLEQALDSLPELVEQFRSGKAPETDVEMLRQMAFEVVEPGGLKLPAETPSQPAAVEQGESEQVAESPLQPEAEQKAETEAPSLDPVLLEIYAKEADGHLQEIESYIEEWRQGGSHKVSEPLIRALHTLQGSSRMAGVLSVAEVCAVLEKYAKALQANHHGVDEQGIEALASCAEFVREMLAFLVDGKGEALPDSTSAQQKADAVYTEVKHLEPAANAQPEAGLASRTESDSSAAQGTEVAEAAGAVDESQEAKTAPAPVIEPENSLPAQPLQGDAVSSPSFDTTPPPAVEEEYDPELLEIFLEEGRDILDASEETLQAWVDSPDDRALVEQLQRQLHTLKGGARMAGITPIGDLSHSLESTFEAVVEGRLDRSPQMMDLLQLSHDRLVTMLEQISSHQPVVGGEDLIRQVDILAKGGAPEDLALPQHTAAEESEKKKVEEPSVAEVVTKTDDTPKADVAASDEEPPKAKLSLVEPLEPQPEIDLTWVEAAIAEFELNYSNWLRNIADQAYFDHLYSSTQALLNTCNDSGIVELGDIAAAIEKLLVAIRDGHVPASKKTGDMVALGMDRLKLIITQRKQGQPLDNGQFLVTEIDELIARGIAEQEAVTPASVPRVSEKLREAADRMAEQSPAVSGEGLEEKGEAEGDKRRAPRIQHEMVRVRADLLDNLVNYAGEVSIYRSRVEQQIGTFGSNIGEMDQTIDRLRDQIRQVEIENEAQIESRREEAQKQGYEDFDPLEFDRFTNMQQLSRSMAESLNDLMSIEDILTGLARETETLLLQQSRVNTELQESLVHTRMVPLVDNAPRLRRIVRQTAAELDKRATLRFDGAEVEMDRNVVERMMAPLEHMLRNSIAHGIEDKAARKSAGKPEEGLIIIALSREGSEIVVRISDDGAGINTEAVKKKAIERGLMKAGSRLNNKEIASFILESGFSTADSVSQIAGRGVGMDVVNSEIKQLGGVMDIDSVQGQGTTFTIRIPLTLSVSRALLVQVGDDTYAIPLLSISGIERIDTVELEQRLGEEDANFEWVGENYDLMHLTQVLGAGQGVVNHDLIRQPLLLARSGEQRVAFAVDHLLGSREIVVKSLGPQLSTLQDLAGATILADGSVALIIDMPSLIRRGLARKTQLELPEAAAPVEIEREPIIMVVDDSITVRKVTERLLKRHNMRCITAKDGVDALTVLEENTPDVMLLDIEMPRMDGFELATHMRNSERYKEIPIIMITSRTGEKHRQRAMDIGVNIYMGKPYTEVDLLENIETLMEKS